MQRKHTKMTKVVKYIAGAAVVIAAAVGYGAYLLFSSPFTITDKTCIYVDADDTMDSLYSKVSDAGKPASMRGFKLMSTLKRFSKPRTGCYTVEPEENMFTLVRRLANGGQSPIQLKVPEVRTVEDMVGRLAAQLMINADEIVGVLNDSEFMESLGYKKETLPCLFIPNTYEAYWNMSARGLVNRLHKEKKAFWNEDRTAKAQSIGMTPEEVVTLASIVESETSYGPEKATVAGLYKHRMEIEMPLQSDPTVIFAVGDFSIRRVLLEHLQMDSPYNTYRNLGLPPGPIRIPSIQGIDAVLNYDHNSYVYMCAKEDFSGSHNFTSSYAEHLQNAARYQQALNRRGIMK